MVGGSAKAGQHAKEAEERFEKGWKARVEWQMEAEEAEKRVFAVGRGAAIGLGGDEEQKAD